MIQALVNAVKEGKVVGAGLNVYEMKLKVHSGLLNSEKIVLLPHIETATFQTQICRIWFIFNKMCSLIIKNLTDT